MICIHEVIYSVCSRNFCGILSASEDFMTHDEMMSLLANTLADAAGSSGCLPILDCFSPHPGEEVTVSIPMCDDTVDIVPVSYTHLDVYKRQMPHSPMQNTLSRISARMRG